MTLPRFLCIGAQKAGTSWLFAQLQTHPEIWMPPVKEVQYFTHLYVPRNRNWTLWHIRTTATRALKRHMNFAKKVDFSFVRYLTDFATREPFSEDWYRRAFDRPGAIGKMVGEITPEYSTIPDQGIRHIRSLLGAVKITYIIREPVSRALSQLKMNVSRKGANMSSLREWIEMADQWNINNRGDYRTYVPRWKAHFAEEDILFLPYGRIARDPIVLLREVENFLGLSQHDYAKAADRVHATTPVSVPDEIVARLTKRMEEQRAFIADEFGRDFLEAT